MSQEIFLLAHFFEKSVDTLRNSLCEHNEKTLDEAPMAYKSLEDIIDVVSDAVDVIEVLKPIYNFKASE